MKVAFLGKGGSGKSTMATALVRHLCAQGLRVLAIDADHNMDLSFNLGADPTVFLGSDPDYIKEYVGSERAGTYAEALRVSKQNGIEFSLSPADAFTAAMSVPLSGGALLMTAGPHTPRVRAGDACSHSLAAPLKVYLPRLRLRSGEWVVIDERAGTDPVATGILRGVDLAIIVREPTVHSQRVAAQIARELMLARIPHLIVDNKINTIEADTSAAIDAVLPRAHAVST